MTNDIPEWAKSRACDLMNEARPAGQPAYSISGLDFDGKWTGIAVAFARYIAAHEEPPVDPLLSVAREVMALCCDEWGELDRAEKYRAGKYDKDGEMQKALAVLKRSEGVRHNV